MISYNYLLNFVLLGEHFGVLLGGLLELPETSLGALGVSLGTLWIPLGTLGRHFGIIVTTLGLTWGVIWDHVGHLGVTVGCVGSLGGNFDLILGSFGISFDSL